MIFRDRDDAGRRLAGQLAGATFQNPVVLALPRGGVPVGAQVASALGAPLEVFVVRKVGAPAQPELGIGAIAEGSDEVVETSAVSQLGIGPERLRSLVDEERTELARRIQRYRGTNAVPDLDGRDVIVVDDGLATGVTAEAALRSVRDRGPRRCILATPVCSPATADRLGAIADDVVCVAAPENLVAIGTYYEDFDQTTDDEVLDLLASFRPGPSDAASPGGNEPVEREITIAVPGGDAIYGDLTVPKGAVGVVLFAHGSGSSRHSPRNRAVASALSGQGLATMRGDLLTAEEEREDAASGRYRFDIDLLADRLGLAERWLAEDTSTSDLPLGLFGASTGAAAALVAAARSGDRVGAVVSRGGRPDLAGDALPDVTAPTLLIVGGLDETVLQFNKDAHGLMRCDRELKVVRGAGHLFEEPGALDEVAALAGDWFTTRLAGSSRG